MKLDKLYNQIIKQIIKSGKRIVSKSGKIKDIGVRKLYLTREDIRIERELKKIISNFDPKHKIYAEEEERIFTGSDDVWIVDPISGTHMFIEGLPHYGIVVSHLHEGKIQFAAVYDPSMDEIYTAYREKGTYHNGQRFRIKKKNFKRKRILFNLSYKWKDWNQARRIAYDLGRYDLYRIPGSHSVNAGQMALGRFNGVVSLTKDSFPYFASSLIVNEAGGVYTNIRGERDIRPTDRVFIGGDKKTYQQLKRIIEKHIK